LAQSLDLHCKDRVAIERVRTMGRVGLVLVMMVVTLVVGSGVAFAAVKFGTGRCH
jgi:hypothetical protein